MFVSCFVRLFLIDKYPVGLNQDEASSGYEAFSLFNYGIDRNGASYPIHFNAWGSGQNALYSYLIMLFINVVKNPLLAIRLPMALIGCFTMLVCYKFIKDHYYNKKGIMALFIFAIIPWHIMKSRWGLESNLFPDLFLYGLFSLYYGLKTKRKLYYFLSSIIFGVSVYSYGTSYVFIPVFLVMTYIYLIITKKVNYKESLLYIAVTGLVALPMVIFVIINYFNLDTIKVFNVTIPKLDYNRFTTITSVNGNFISNCLINLKNAIKIIIYQEDGLVLNTIGKFGTIYLISLPFVIYGFILSLKNFKKNILYSLVLFSFLSSIVVSMMVIPNINRINHIWFSLIIYLIIGLINISKTNSLFYKTILITYFLIFTLFIKTYFTVYQKQIHLPKSLDSAISYAETLEYNKLYITHDINQPYIYYLLYNKIDPNYYISKRIIENKHVMFQKVLSIDNVYFDNPSKLLIGNIYIFKTSHNIDSSMCEKTLFNDFKVINCVKQ